MDPTTLTLVVGAAVLSAMALRVPIGYALGLAAALGIWTLFSWRPGREADWDAGLVPATQLISSTAHAFVHNHPLSMIPLFIGLGHVAFHAGITTNLYGALRVLLGRLPGGLAMASVTGCGGFSAITGSSVACAAAMGRIAVPEMLRFGYAPRLAAGAVAAGGTLGSLIPPSLLFVIYAIFTEQSVNALFLAGVVPGLMSLAGYLLTILAWRRLRPADAPADATRFTPAERRAALLGLWPAALLFAIIVGGIYLGVFTATEAAAVSLVTAVAIGFARRTLTLASLWEAGLETVRQTAMIFLVALAAKLFTAFVSLSRVTPRMLDALEAWAPSYLTVLLLVVLFYLVIGMFLDSIGILVLTLPFTVPIMSAYGADLIWFGVIVVKLLEIGLITPPIGLNIFVIKGVTPPGVTLGAVFAGASAFLVLDLVVLALLVALPALSLALPASAM